MPPPDPDRAPKLCCPLSLCTGTPSRPTKSTMYFHICTFNICICIYPPAHPPSKFMKIECLKMVFILNGSATLLGIRFSTPEFRLNITAGASLISTEGALRLPTTYDNNLIPSQSHPSVRHKASKSSEQASD